MSHFFLRHLRLRYHGLFKGEIYDNPTFSGSGPGFVNRTQSDPGFVNPVRSGPGFVNPIRSDPVLVLLTPEMLLDQVTLASCAGTNRITFTTD